MANFFLIGGHGLDRVGGSLPDVGAVGNGYQEYRLARLFNKILAKYLITLNQKVTIYNEKRNMFARTNHGKGLNSFGVNGRIVIETHLNASVNKKANGTETLISSGMKADKYDNAIHNTLKKHFTDRGIKKRGDLLNMNVSARRGINYRLIELCFISNKTDVEYLVKNMDKIAKEMAENLVGKKIPSKNDNVIGVARFLGKDKKECKFNVYSSDVRLQEFSGNYYGTYLQVNTKGRNIYNVATGKKVNKWTKSRNVLVHITKK